MKEQSATPLPGSALLKLRDDLHQLDVATFEIEDIVDLRMENASCCGCCNCGNCDCSCSCSCTNSTSCGCSSSCGTSSTCSSSSS